MRKISWLAIPASIVLTLGSVFLTEGALHVFDRPRASLAQGEAFALSGGSQVTAVRIRAADGVPLDGWLFSPAHPNGGAAIVLHGVGDTRTGVLAQARFLLEAGYAVLTPDSRGHGASGGEVITYGLLEAEDIHRWADLLMQRPGIERLYGAGQSMGAAILIQSLAKEHRFRALAADCPFMTFEQIALDRLAQHGSPTILLSWPVVELGFFYARARYGIDLRRASPEDALRNAGTPVLLIHGTGDHNIPIRHSRELHARYSGGTELWEVRGAGHVGSFGEDPSAYAKRVTAFFAAHREE